MMKSRTLLYLFFLIPVALVTVSTVENVCFATTLDTIRLKSKGINSFIASFIQEKHFKIFPKAIISKGIFYYKAPDSIRWEYFSPIQSILLVYHGKTRRFIKMENGLEEDQSARFQPVMQFVFQEIGLWIRGQFEKDPFFKIKEERPGAIILIPKDKALSQMITRIELLFSNDSCMIDSITIDEGDGSYTRMNFYRVIKNNSIDDSVFQRP